MDSVAGHCGLAVWVFSPRAATNDRRDSTARQQYTANGVMRLAIDTADLMQRLSSLPTVPDVALLSGRESGPFPFAHKHHPYGRRSTRWCCIDLSNAPDSPGTDKVCRHSFSIHSCGLAYSAWPYSGRVACR